MMMNAQSLKNLSFDLSCPIPLHQYPQVTLAHGGGGRLMHQLIEKMFLPMMENPSAHGEHDAAVLDGITGKLVFTTDSYVVRPLFFPGGDIGTLAVNGTVNDLAMAGAKPLYLSVAFILEEGFPMDILWKVTQSIGAAARAARVRIVTGDTKVVDKGKGDGIFINTAGVGIIRHSQIVHPRSVEAGDAVILSGDIGRHGMAIMAVREGLSFESAIESDCAPLADMVAMLLAQDIQLHCLRDLTRGGLASALNEIAVASHQGIVIEEKAVPVREDVASACEMLGLDPFYVANEGRLIAFVPTEQAESTVASLRSHPLGQQAQIIGRVVEDSLGLVTLKSRIGASRALDMLSGEQLPRIC